MTPAGAIRPVRGKKKGPLKGALVSTKIVFLLWPVVPAANVLVVTVVRVVIPVVIAPAANILVAA